MNLKIMDTLREYDEYCPGGFLVTQDDVEPKNGWLIQEYGNFKIHYSLQTEFHFHKDNLNAFCVFGACYDLESELSMSEIYTKVLDLIKVSFSDALEYISYLAGRYLFVIFNGVDSYVVPDSHCTLACYWSDKIPNTFSSHLQIFKDLFSVKESVVTKEIMSHQDYIAPGGKYHPAKLTPLTDIYPLIANCFLKYTPQGNVAHIRFYPFCSLGEKFSKTTKDEKYEKFKKYLISYIKQTYKNDNNYISLTNGGDSRAVLAAACLAGLKYDTFTYARDTQGSVEVGKDLVGASKLATYVGFSHFILILPKLDYASRFFKLYSKTFSIFARFPTLAQAYYEQLPRDANVLISTISETGTIFYQAREEKELTALVLAKKWSFSKNSDDEKVIKLFEEYIDFTQFSAENIYDYDFYDLFYWEHRNSKWGNIWYQECDLSHNVVLPFNARIINELMLSLPEELRRSKYLLNRLIDDAEIPSGKSYFA